jgi:hypothetical protein
MKEPKYRIENGRKIYTMEDRIDCVRRVSPPKPTPPVSATEKTNNTAGEPTSAPASSDTSEDPDVVSVHMRLITADDAFPSVGWLGPQLVKYGHNDGAAVREIPELMARTAHPVPLMWNHSFDAHDIAGKVNDAYWENSRDIKPGVNAWARVRRTFDSKAALGLETGEINATSIGVIMEKERSHPDMDFETFVSLAAVGAEVDGKQVAWLPVKVLEVFHHALVWSGADPNSGPRPVVSLFQEKSNGGNTDSINAEESADHPKRGGTIMDENAWKVLNQLCKDMGFDVVLSEGQEIPTDLLARINNRVAAGTEALTRCFEIDARLSRVKKDILPDKPNASTMETLSALIDKLPMAKHGEAYLADLRSQALAAFDGAKTDPANKSEMTMAEKTVRSVIEATSDVDALKAWAAEYSKAKEDKFPKPDLHTSADEGLPPHVGVAEVSAEQKRISASFQRWQGGKK